MSDWPEGLSTGPLREWPGQLRAHGIRERAKFMRPGRREDGRWIPQSPMPISRTVVDLRRELEAINAENVEMLLAIPAGSAHWRIDGKPRANVTPEHPGVVLSFDLPEVGRVSYPCDKYTRWQDNLRAIVLALEALRLVDRHGVARRGDQYRGYLAIEARPAGAFTSNETAMRFLAEAAGMTVDPALDMISAYDESDRQRIATRALFHSHPDRGGDRDVFEKALAAKAHLERVGLL